MTDQPAPKGHPPGLYVLFFTELWERYSFYSMMAILTLYMDEALHFDAARIGSVYGGYIGGVYLMPLVGGYLADRVLGFYRAVVIGGGLMDHESTTPEFRERYLGIIRETAEPYFWPQQRGFIKIVPAELGDLSQAIGAGLVALYHHQAGI